MSVSVEVDFDPYLAWLQIKEQQRPLSAYQYLNLKALESDFNRIRAAATRQRSLLESIQASAPSEIWQRVCDELEDAIETLLDSDRKQLLDAGIKRQLAKGGSPTDSNRAASGTIRCLCGTENPASRRFCRSCGTVLVDQCPACRAEVTAEERFCGSCGVNVVDARQQRHQELQRQLESAQVMRRAMRFDEAARALRSVALLEDPQLEEYANQAVELLQQIEEERQSSGDQVLQVLERARELLREYAYENALERLESIPVHLRSDEFREVLAEATGKRAELLKLAGEIREALAQQRKAEVLPKLERMLALKPNHTQGRDLAEKLRDEFLAAARKKLSTCNYEEARTLLETIPSFVVNEDVEKLIDKARELESLSADVLHSPLASDVLIGIAERLVKIAPADEHAAKQLVQLRQRRATKPAHPRLARQDWGAIPQRTHIGLPVEPLAYLTRCEIAPAAKAVLDQHPAEFFVAFGLALQARQQAAVGLNLLPAAKGSGGLLSGLSLSLRKPAPRGGWGLDLGSTAVRAIRLSPESTNGRVRIEAAVHLPLVRSAAQQGDDVAAAAVVTEALCRFKEQHPLAGDKEKRDVVVAAVTGNRTLGRFFDLPPAPAKKVADLLEYEAKHQIPVPLTELHWGYQILEEAAGKAADQNSHHMLLLAAKDFLVKQRLAHFEAAGIAVDELSSNPVALHNAIVYEFGESDSFNYAVADIGARGMDFVVSSPKRVWFRTSACGGDGFTDALVKNLQLTQSVAEEIKRAPFKARRYYRVCEAWQPLLLQVGSEIQRSLESYQKQFPDRTVQRLYLTGGGALTHGLLRQLIHGH